MRIGAGEGGTIEEGIQYIVSGEACCGLHIDYPQKQGIKTGRRCITGQNELYVQCEGRISGRGVRVAAEQYPDGVIESCKLSWCGFRRCGVNR